MNAQKVKVGKTYELYCPASQRGFISNVQAITTTGDIRRLSSDDAKMVQRGNVKILCVAKVLSFSSLVKSTDYEVQDGALGQIAKVRVRMHQYVQEITTPVSVSRAERLSNVYALIESKKKVLSELTSSLATVNEEIRELEQQADALAKYKTDEDELAGVLTEAMEKGATPHELVAMMKESGIVNLIDASAVENKVRPKKKKKAKISKKFRNIDISEV